MVDYSIETEICVIGGGPAGSTIAHKLALLGHDVCLIEKSVFPRPHIGESLPPSILPVLDLLNVRERVETAGFLRPQQSLLHWFQGGVIQKPFSGEAGFQVDRDRFDQLLLDAAQEAGVHIIQPARAGRPVSAARYQWQIPIQTKTHRFTLNAQFLIDATGKTSVLKQKPRYSPPTIALYGYWRNTDMQGTESRVEAGTDAWYWGAPLPNGTFNAVVFLDAKQYGQIRSSDRSSSLEQIYCDLLSQTTLLKACLDGHLETPVTICDASSYLVESCIDQDWIKVGEAAFSIDPLSSQGVQMAIVTAFQGSIAVHTILTKPDRSEAAIAFYHNKLQETVARNRRTSAQLYAAQNLHPINAFWRDRANCFLPPTTWTRNQFAFDLNSPIQLSEAATLIDTPVILDDFIQTTKALHHPGLDSPIAYLGPTAIAPLLNDLTTGQTVVDLMRKWSKRQELSTCWQLLQWLWSRHIIVPYSA